MTLQELFTNIGDNPTAVVLYFAFVPIAATVVSIGSGKEGHMSPWTYLFSGLIYLSCVPGILAFVLTVYTFLFERKSILQMDLLVYFLPIISMAATLFIVRRKVDLRYIPGFSQLSGLLLMLMATFVVMLVFQKIRLLGIFFLSTSTLVGLFLGLFGLFMFGWMKLTKKE